jgi:hypothetical protein
VWSWTLTRGVIFKVRPGDVSAHGCETDYHSAHVNTRERP